MHISLRDLGIDHIDNDEVGEALSLTELLVEETELTSSSAAQVVSVLDDVSQDQWELSKDTRDKILAGAKRRLAEAEYQVKRALEAISELEDGE